jgi:hypothetical protein
MNQKQIIIGGIALLAVIVVAGIVFSPSGFIPARKGGSYGAACVKLGTNSERCETSEYWQETTFNSLQICDDQLDPNGFNCRHREVCTCKVLDE